MSGITAGGVGSSPITSGTLVSNIFNVNLTLAVGTVTALVGTIYTTTVAGLLTTDAVIVQCTGSMAPGAAIANARASATNTLEITFITAVALGLTLGSLGYRLTVIR